MFTGIIETTAEVLENQASGCSNRLLLTSPFSDLLAGESLAINGVCLTLLPRDAETLSFDLSPETLRLSNLSTLVPGVNVNLERAIQASTRLGGHYVNGHVDCKAIVTDIHFMDECMNLTLEGFKKRDYLYLIPKGSVAVDGVSLTINSVTPKGIQLMLIPHTLSCTTLSALKLGQEVNIEFDYLTQVIAHQLQILGRLQNEVSE